MLKFEKGIPQQEWMIFEHSFFLTILKKKKKKFRELKEIAFLHIISKYLCSSLQTFTSMFSSLGVRLKYGTFIGYKLIRRAEPGPNSSRSAYFHTKTDDYELLLV